MVANKQADVMRAALVLFAERGYDGTTVPMIAAKAQVGAGTIYRYFQNKEDLVNALFQQSVNQFSACFSPYLLDKNLSIREQFRHVFHAMVKFAEEEPDTLLFIDSHNNAYYLDDVSREVFNQMLVGIIEVLEQGKAQGTVKDLDSKALICIVYGAFIQMFKLLNTCVLAKDDTLINGLEECCWHAIRV